MIETAIRSVDAAVYTVPTDAPEADGTLSWDATTMVLVQAHAGCAPPRSPRLTAWTSPGTAGRTCMSTPPPLSPTCGTGIQYANTLHVANFKMVTRDSGGDPSTGANLVRQLAQSGVKAIFAGTTDVAAVHPVANQRKILVADSGGITGIVSEIRTDKESPGAFCPDTACGASTTLPEVQFLIKVNPNGTIGAAPDNPRAGSDLVPAERGRPVHDRSGHPGGRRLERRSPAARP